LTEHLLIGRAENAAFLSYAPTGTPPAPPDLDAGQRGSWLPVPLEDGVSLTITGENPRRALVDNWFFVRYKGLKDPDGVALCGVEPPEVWSPLAGSPAGTPTEPEAQLAEGWVKRATLGLNAFEARGKDFHASAVNTFASMLVRAGERFEGEIALSPDPDSLNQVGLIEAYETVFRRAVELALAAGVSDDGPLNNALLLAASRIADLYVLLGDEAYADAADPTIGFGTQSGEVGTLAPAIFSFENQLDSLLEEELVLLRGRDDTTAGVAARPMPPMALHPTQGADFLRKVVDRGPSKPPFAADLAWE